MRLNLVLLTLIVAVSGCTTKHKLSTCRGPLIVMNQNQWQPSQMEVDALGKLCPEEK